MSCDKEWGTQSQAVIQIHISHFFRFFSHCLQSCFNHVQPFATLQTIALKAPLSTGFFRQEYWSGLPCPSPRDLPDPGIKPASPALAGRFFTTSTTWQAQVLISYYIYIYMCVCVCVCVYVNTNLSIYPFPHIYHIWNIPQPYKRIK